MPYVEQRLDASEAQGKRPRPAGASWWRRRTTGVGCCGSPAGEASLS
jgi:hypothetical protein